MSASRSRLCENSAAAAQRLALFRHQRSQDCSGPNRLDQRLRAEHGAEPFQIAGQNADAHLGRLPWSHQARNFVISDALKIDLLKAVEKTRRKVHVRRGIHSLNGPPSSLKQPEVASLTARAICLRRLFCWSLMIAYLA